MRWKIKQAHALGLTSCLPPNITTLDKLFVWVAHLATHTHACNTYRIPKWARHLKSISISLIPHPVPLSGIANPDKLFPTAFVTLPAPFLQISRRGKNVKKINLSPAKVRLSKLEGQVEPLRKKSPNSPNHNTCRGSLWQNTETAKFKKVVAKKIKISE